MWRQGYSKVNIYFLTEKLSQSRRVPVVRAEMTLTSCSLGLGPAALAYGCLLDLSTHADGVSSRKKFRE